MHESQKLLAHLLHKLETRIRPPDLLGRAAASARAQARHASVGDKGKAAKVGEVFARLQSPISAGAQASPIGQGISNDDINDDDGADVGEWDAEATTELLVQVRDLLLLANKQHLDLFSAARVASPPSSVETPAKGKRRAGRLSSFVSPVSPAHERAQRNRGTAAALPSASETSGPDMRHRLDELLCQILGGDIAHRIRKHRLLAPPLMLYSTTLDVMTLLYETASETGQARLVESVIGSLYNVPDLAIGKVCAWLESHLIHLFKEAAGASASTLAPETAVQDFRGQSVTLNM